MGIDTFYDYLECLPILESQEMLNNLTISDWPNLKKEARQKLHKSVYKSAYPSIFRSEKRATLEDVARILSGR